MLIKILLLHYLIMSIVSAAMHAADKRRAIKARRRIPERSLHSMELVGGWPGAIMMTRMIRHKTSKPSYMWTLYAIAALHIVAIMLLMWWGTR
ncbi:MAG: DUF1294 domain-containing protein [Phycisphaerales bacterium JB052]